jgi:mannose-6-phosphate isomerase-like protein (cupin superfamily)
MSEVIETGPRITEGVGDFLGQTHHFSSGVYAKQMLIPAGHVVGSHAHQYSHLSVLASGDIILEVDNVATEFSGPACIEIKAGCEHKVFAKTDAVWFCIHATEATNADEVDAVLIAEGKA